MVFSRYRGSRDPLDLTKQEYFILAALRSGRAHGYKIASLILVETGYQFTDATFYAAVERLRRAGLLAVESVEGRGLGPPKKVLAITDRGREGLDQYWGAMVRARFMSNRMRASVEALSEAQDKAAEHPSTADGPGVKARAFPPSRVA